MAYDKIDDARPVFECIESRVIVLVQSLDLLSLKSDRRIAPTETDIRMMAFSFREFTNLLNKGERLPEISKPEAPLEAVSLVRQLPVRGLCVKELLVRE